MLKQFWKNKKYLVQFVGILAGIGALFLSISPPDNLKAREALANVQLVWLLIITITVVLLFIEFIQLSDRWEKDMMIKKGFDITDTISMFVSLTALYVIFNLWIYIINLYNNSLWDFLRTVNFAIFSLIGAVYFHFWRKIIFKISGKSIYKKIIFSFFTHMFTGTAIGISFEFALVGKNFSITHGLQISAIVVTIIMLLGFYEYVHTIKRK